MSQPTQGEWRTVGNTAIYAGDKMIAMTAVKDISDYDERRANMDLMAAAKDLLEALEVCYKSLATYEPHPVIAAQVKAAITKARKTELRNQQ